MKNQIRITGILRALAFCAAIALCPTARTQSQTSTPASSNTAPASGSTGSTTTPKSSSKPAATAPAHKTQPSAASAKSSTSTTLTTAKQKDSYALGLNVTRGLQQQVPVDLDVASYLQGVKDALTKAKPQLTDDEVKAALSDLSKEANDKVQAANQAAGEANLKQGQDFLAQNKTKPGVVTTPSGLQYKVITMGTGPKPGPSDTVVCDYSGTLIDGTEFDSSYKRKQPIAFPVGGVIKGWTEALQMMPAGSKWELYIPSDLAYGPRGNPPIGPNETLIFQVELHSIKSK